MTWCELSTYDTVVRSRGSVDSDCTRYMEKYITQDILSIGRVDRVTQGIYERFTRGKTTKSTG